ncbi:unnamed protein product [Caenorhabditis angaria]|uniref:Endonuclease/exonuclease/phosphatase domain-containing protein n=1 Tax=Caenorhabditis angaria TaxID=860376 RepID=A0A9P1J117_9PELO|nr:unnamed protein product [Caenorhabditis angaria]
MSELPGKKDLNLDLNLKLKSKVDPADIEDSFSLADEPVEVTNWRLIYITGIVSFLCAIEGAAVHMSEWPYMKQIDPEATVKFFGIASSASKAAHAIFVLFFAVWSFKFKTVRAPLIAGRIIAILACILYLGVEYLPTGRRYLMMVCYILFDISGSSPAILRAYVAAISAPKDRAKAFATMSLSMVLSIILGPLIQLIFTKIPYPGWEITEHLKINVYSAPIWIANSTNFVSILIIFFGLEELPRKIKEKKLKKPSIFEWEGLKMRIAKIRSSNINWILVLVIWIAKCGKTITARSIGTLMPILLMVNYGWTGIQTVRITSILMGGSGLLSMVVIGSFMFCKLATIISPRFIYLFSISLFIALYAVTYPYPNIGVEVQLYNETDGTGCDSTKYTWCETAIAPQPALFLSCMVFVFGLTIPSTSISLDTIYSKVLGNIDQSVMQGAAVILDDIMLVITPTYASYIFTFFGLKPLWIINAGIMIGVVVGRSFLEIFYLVFGLLSIKDCFENSELIPRLKMLSDLVYQSKDDYVQDLQDVQAGILIFFENLVGFFMTLIAIQGFVTIPAMKVSFGYLMKWQLANQLLASLNSASFYFFGVLLPPHPTSAFNTTGLKTNGERRSNLGAPTTRHWKKNKEKCQPKTRKIDARICTFNCRSIATDDRLADLLQEADRIKYDIIGLSETKRGAEIQAKSADGTGIFLGKRNEVSVSGGVGFITHKSMTPKVKEVKFINHRIATLTFYVSKRFDCTVIQVYAPIGTSDAEEIAEFYENVEDVIRQCKSKFKIVMGDFNARIGSRANSSEIYIGTHSMEPKKRTRRISGKFLREQSLLQHQQLLRKTNKSKMDLHIS